MYLDEAFIKHPSICIVLKRELVCVFPFLGNMSLEIKKRLQNAIERTLPYCKLKVIFKSSSKIVNHAHFKDVLPKKLCSGIAHCFNRSFTLSKKFFSFSRYSNFCNFSSSFPHFQIQKNKWKWNNL